MKNIWTDPKSGKVWHRTRRAGKLSLTPLPALPFDHPDFIAAWSAAHRGTTPEPVDPGSLGSAWRAILASPTARIWSLTYHQKISRHAAAITAKAGSVKNRAVRPEHIRADIDSATVPADRLRAWRVWGTWCLDRGLITADPSLAVKAPKAPKTEGHPPWTAADIAAFRHRWPIGTAPRAVMELAHWTGARASDLVRLGPQMVGADGVMTYRQQKTREPAYVPWTCPLPDFISTAEPDRAAMHSAIAHFAGHLCLIPTRTGRPRSSKSICTMIQKCCKTAGIAVSIHGLRKSRAIALIEGGATTHQAMAWTGHLTEKELAHYARAFNRRAAVTGTPAEQNLDVSLAQVDVVGA